MRQVISGMRAAIARTLMRPVHWPRTRRLAVIGGTMALAALAWVGTGLSQTSLPTMALASEPLYAASAGDKPVMALALSVEYPTVGAQYLGQTSGTDSTYSNLTEYIGYYNAESCYRYINTPVETPGVGQTAADYRRFERTGAATSRMCDDAFSGNFLNWATSSAIDMLRLALSGGDRWIDTEDLTVLQRALIPNGNPVCMGNTYVFPAKRLTRAGNGTRNYWGAVPNRMATAAGTNDIWITSTLDQIYFGTQQPTVYQDNNTTFCTSGKTGYTLKPATATIDPGSNTDGFFYARVRVCESDGNGNLLDQRDYKLCTRYPNGKYKPTGTIQKHSDQLRLAAFGYLMDQTRARYGGVLRAPMKYVGNKTFDSAGRENTPATGNPKREWDPQTGIFILNPESATDYPISGVINYLNRFGRTGPTPGLYKRYDPVSTLYYETLRYLQGLQPYPDAVSGLTSAMYDGFPVYTSWTDPYGDGRSATGSYSCLKSNIIVIGDVNTSADNATVWPAANAANNIPNIDDWANIVSSFERGSTANYIDGAGVTRQTSNPNTPNSSPTSRRLIGAAYWAHTHDIRGTGWTSEPGKQRPGLRVNTMLFDVNEMGLENPVNKRRYQNQFFTAAKYGGYNSMNGPDASPKSFNTYGNPFKRDDGTTDNDIWQKPDAPGEASAYYLQSSARSVLSAFDRIFEIASAQAHSIAGGAVKSTRLENGDYFYEGTFDSKDWSGDLSATSISVTVGASVSDESVALGTKAWSASEKLSALSAPASTRNIVIGQDGAINEDGTVALPIAVNFTWDQIGSTAQTALNGVDNMGQQRLNYLRGDRTNDGATFRDRNKKLLGDIINSGPVYSGAPAATINSETYPDFVADNKNRTPAVFVGANDGMLHAFNANDGTELFGYIPSWLTPKLAALTDAGYPLRHQSYVDATPAVAEAQLGNAGSKADWATVLVSGTGAGGRGVFALDVTNPAAFDPDKVLWEFTPASDADIGYVIGQPRIVKLRTSAPDAKSPTYKWFAMVASGVNNYVASDILPHSSTGAPALFLLDLAKPAGTPWTLNSNYYKIVFPVDDASGLAPGLANFEVVLGTSQTVTKVYAGDLQGNVWKLDFERAGSTQWNLASLSPFKNGSQVLPLFIAKDKTGRRQPITTAPKPLRGANGTSVYVAIGTGKYLEYSDRGTSNMDSLYVVYDPNNNPSGTAISGRDLLQPGTVNASSGSVSIDPFAWGIPVSSSDTSKRAGWYVDLPGTGERQVAPIQVLGNQILFSTLSPSTAGSTDACGNGNSNSWSYAASIDTGNGTRRVSTIGLLSAPLIVETTASVNVGESDSTGRRIRSSRVYSIQQGSNGAAVGPGQTVRTVVGRLSWRQINNYLDLKK